MLKKTGLSAVLPNYNQNLIRALLGFRFEQRILPELKAGEVLVETAFAPCNPSDIAFLRGGYNIIKPIPAVPGFEASGTIVNTSRDVSSLMGKNVSCFVQADHDGTWASHFIARSVDCIVLKEGMDMKQAACLSINPLTALALYENVISKKCNAFIVNAAGGHVPAFMKALADRDQIEVIQIVRKTEQVKLMLETGATYVLDSNSENFNEELKKICAQLNPSMAFDAVGGEISGKILNAMPVGGELMVYGALGGSQLEGISAMDVIFNGKSIRGFNLNNWIGSMNAEVFKTKTDYIQDLVLEGTWRTLIHDSYPLNELVQGIRTYIQSMSSGKVLFHP